MANFLFRPTGISTDGRTRVFPSLVIEAPSSQSANKMITERMKNRCVANALRCGFDEVRLELVELKVCSSETRKTGRFRAS